MDEQRQIFRKSSLERISSPEQLNDYVRVANPGVWMILAALIILLAGFCVWAAIGEIEVTANAVCVSNDGDAHFYVSEEYADRLNPGMPVKCGDIVATVTGIDDEAMEASDVLTGYGIHVGGFRDGEWIHEFSTDMTFPDGVFSATVLIENVKPVSFILD